MNKAILDGTTIPEMEILRDERATPVVELPAPASDEKSEVVEK